MRFVSTSILLTAALLASPFLIPAARAGCLPFDTTCDFVDDDCDGFPDDDYIPQPTVCGLGECAGNAGSTFCQGGQEGDTCDPFSGALPDDDCNGRDDDCDGSTDEHFVDGPSTCGVGACAGNTGVRSCTPEPPMIYGSNRDAELRLYDLTALVDVPAGTLLFGTQAMELDPATGRIYYFENFNSANEFGYWDPATGQNTLVRTYSPAPGIFPKRLAVAPDGSMIMMDNEERFYDVDKANGDLTLRGTATGVTPGFLGATGDFAYATDGTLYLATYRALYTFDTQTLHATLLHDDLLTDPGIQVFTGVAFCDGELYLSDVQESTARSAIYRVDPVTGQIDFLWLGAIYLNDLTSCPANGRREVVFEDTCDPFAGASPDTTCDGIDDDCDGDPDDDAAPPTGTPLLTLDRDGLDWTPVATAQTYRAVRGGLVPLRAGGGDFGVAADTCVAPATAATSATDPAIPSADAGFWYLVAADNCAGSGGFDSVGAGQSGSRDAELATAAVCP